MIVVATYYAALQILNWKWTAKIFAILLVFIGGFSSYFVNTLGVIISPDQIQNIAQTDVAGNYRFTVFAFWALDNLLCYFTYFLITQVKLKSEKILPLLLKKYFQSLLHLPL